MLRIIGAAELQSLVSTSTDTGVIPRSQCRVTESHPQLEFHQRISPFHHARYQLHRLHVPFTSHLCTSHTAVLENVTHAAAAGDTGCFTAADPRLWNNLPDPLRQTDISFEQFGRLLTRHFCSGAKIAAHCG